MVQPYVDVYLTQETMNTVENMFPYLVDRRKATGGGGVGALRWHIINPSEPFTIKRGSARVQVTPLPVLHGFVDRTKPFECVGFRIEELSYISDCVSGIRRRWCVPQANDSTSACSITFQKARQSLSKDPKCL